MPVGKRATIPYNFTPTSSGSYEISVVVDPNKLYDITDRQSAQSSTTVLVSSTERAAPYSNFPTNAADQDTFLMNPKGYATTLYFDNFTKYFYLTNSNQVNNLLYPFLDIFASYINRIAVSHAYYFNYSLTSMWINGYISPSSIDVAAAGKGINVTHINNVSVMNFGNSTTLCSWYSGGWTKTLVSISGKNCTAYITNTTNTFDYSNLYFDLKNRNMSWLNYSGYAPNMTYTGDISLNGNAIVFESLMKSPYFSNVCSGNILNVSNNSYCMGTFYQGNATLDEINRLIGPYNVSVWWISLPNATQESANYALNLTSSYVFSGNHTTFVSAFADRCFFTNNITCQNPVLASNATNLRVGVDIINKYNKTLTINKMGCALIGNFTLSNLGINILAGKNATVYLPCYNSGAETNSSIIPVGFPIPIELNYSYENIANTTYGFAEITK